MNPQSGWRSFRVGHGVFDRFRLNPDGSVLLGSQKFALGEPLDFRWSGYRAHRDSGSAAMLLLTRPDGISVCFCYQQGNWYRYTALFKVGRWRLAWDEIVCGWGLASVFIAIIAMLIPLTGIAVLIAFVWSPWQALVGLGWCVFGLLAACIAMASGPPRK